MSELEAIPQPQGQPCVLVQALPRDTNGHGQIHAGWVLNHMDTAAALAAERVAQCRVVTVSVGSTDFLSPITVGSNVAFYAKVTEVGRSSLKVAVEVWCDNCSNANPVKIADGSFILVAVQENGHVQVINK